MASPHHDASETQAKLAVTVFPLLVIAYLAQGDVALSVTMTSISTLLASLLTPLLALWLVGARMNVQGSDMAWLIFSVVCSPSYRNARKRPRGSFRAVFGFGPEIREAMTQRVALTWRSP